jgi:hypothetical protein
MRPFIVLEMALAGFRTAGLQIDSSHRHLARETPYLFVRHNPF